jgi:hypothetical protein
MISPPLRRSTSTLASAKRTELKRGAADIALSYMVLRSIVVKVSERQ